jgi:hypothetical protein
MAAARLTIARDLPGCRSRSQQRSCDMTGKDKPHDSKNQDKIKHPGMMGDGTEEQNLGERGDPSARIKKSEVEEVFGKQTPKKG